MTVYGAKQPKVRYFLTAWRGTVDSRRTSPPVEVERSFSGTIPTPIALSTMTSERCALSVSLLNFRKVESPPAWTLPSAWGDIRIEEVTFLSEKLVTMGYRTAASAYGVQTARNSEKIHPQDRSENPSFYKSMPQPIDFLMRIFVAAGSS